MNKKYIPYIIIVILLLLLGFLYQRNQSLIRKEKIGQQNFLAEKDSITQIFNKKTGELEASKAAYISRAKDLENYNAALSKQLKNTEGDVVTLSTAIFRLKQDTAILRKALRDQGPSTPPIQLNDSTYAIMWDLLYEYDSVNMDHYKGMTQVVFDFSLPGDFKLKHKFTELTWRESRIDLTFGQRVENKQLRVFARSAYPGFSAEQLEGVLIDPNTNPYIKDLMEKQHWFTGFGVGPSINLGYDFLNARPAVILGVGIQYNIYNW